MRIASKKELSRLPTVIPATDCTALLKVLSTLVLQPQQPLPKSETTLSSTTNATMKNGDGSTARTVVKSATSSFPTTSSNVASVTSALASAAAATDFESVVAFRPLCRPQFMGCYIFILSPWSRILKGCVACILIMSSSLFYWVWDTSWRHSGRKEVVIQDGYLGVRSTTVS